MKKQTMALDSQRTIDDNGHLIVGRTIITKATVNKYMGSEIPNYEQLGLDADKVYSLLRCPEELKKSLDTFKGLQLLNKHIAVSAEEPKKDSTVGSIGSNIEMVGDDVYADLRVFDEEAIDLIESGKLAELSSGYFYDADMQKGSYNGHQYDGVMRNIHGNHVALVARGRIGRDAIVADSQSIEIMEKEMGLKKGTLDKLKATLLAFDADISDEDVEKVAKVVTDGEDKTAEDNDKPALDGEEPAKDEQTQAERDNESEADRLKEREEREESDRERDKKIAQDAENKAVARVTALFEARECVKPLVGAVNMALDSAEAVYGFALKEKGVSITGVHESAYKSMVGMLLSQKNTPVSPKIAQDAESIAADKMTSRFK